MPALLPVMESVKSTRKSVPCEQIFSGIVTAFFIAMLSGVLKEKLRCFYHRSAIITAHAYPYAWSFTDCKNYCKSSQAQWRPYRSHCFRTWSGTFSFRTLRRSYTGWNLSLWIQTLSSKRTCSWLHRKKGTGTQSYLWSKKRHCMSYQQNFSYRRRKCRKIIR